MATRHSKPMAVFVSMAGGWKVPQRSCESLLGVRLMHVELVPDNVYDGHVFLHDKSCEVCGHGGYDGAGVISIEPSNYAWDPQTDVCPSLLLLDDVSVTLALAAIEVDLRLAFATPTDCGVFTEWFVRSARAAHDARLKEALQTGRGSTKRRRPCAPVRD